MALCRAISAVSASGMPSRAEVAKLLVYALGQGTQTEQYKGRRDFSDTTGHWADGAIALAKSSSIMQGYPEGDFRPENPVTYAEILAALSRLGSVGAGAEPWPLTYVGPARDAGIVPADFSVEERLNSPAIRGDVFVLLKRTVADLKNLQGQSLLQLYFDKTSPDVTLDPVAQDTQYAALPVSGTAKGAAVVKINGEPVTLADGGYFRQDVPLLIGPNTIRVQALDDAGNLKEATAQVSRQPGAPNSITIQGPPTVKVRQAAGFIIGLLDANGADSADRSKIQADVSPADMGKFDPTTGIFTAATRLGTAVITVQSGAAVSSLSVTVEPGAPDRVTVTPAVISLGAGESMTFKAAGMDAFGNQVSLSDVLWSADGGEIGADGRFVAPDDGARTYTVTAMAAGRTGAAKVYPVNYQATNIRVTAPAAALRANGVSEVALTATVLDSKGQPLTDYKGVLSVQASDERIAEPLERTVQVVGGMAQIPLRVGTMAGTVRIAVSTNLDKFGFINLTTTAPKLQAVRLTGRPMPSTDGSPMGTVEAVALDQDGNPFRSPLPQTLVLGLTVKSAVGANVGAGLFGFVSNGSKEADIGLTDLNPDTGDVRTQIMVRYPEGIGTITVEGKLKAGPVAGVQVYAGAIIGDQVGLPVRLGIEPIVDTPAGQVRSVYVNVLDVNGYRVTQAGPLTGIVVTLHDQTGQPWDLTQVEPGRYRFDVTQRRAGTYTYTARLQPKGATAKASGKVTAANIDAVKVQTSDVIILADNQTEAILKVELVDTNGNRVTAPYLVTFEPGSLAGVTQPQPLTNYTVTSVNGVAQLRVTAGRVVGEQEFRVSVANPAAPTVEVTRGSVTVTTRGVAQRLELLYGDNNRNGNADVAGDNIGRAAVPFLVDVAVLDETDEVVTYEGSRPVKLTVLNLDTNKVEVTQNGSAVKGRAAFTVNLTKVGHYAIKAESTGVLSSMTRGYGGTVANATIEAGHSTNVKIAVDTNFLEAVDSPGNYALVTAYLSDASGNPATNQSGQDMTVALTMPDTISAFFTLDNEHATAYKPTHRPVTIRAGASASEAVKLFGHSVGVVNIQIESPDGVKSASTKVTVMKLGKIASLAVLELAQPPAGPLPSGSRVVQITALDASKRRLAGTVDKIHVAGLSNGAEIVGYYDETGLVPLGVKDKDIPTDRGRIIVALRAPAGLAAFEAYESRTPAVKDILLRPSIYLQF